MKTKTHPQLLLTSLLAILITQSAFAADVAFMAVFKNQVFEQGNPYIASLVEDYDQDDRKPLNFGVFISASGQNSVTSATFTPPGGSPQAITADGNDGSLNFEAEYEARPFMDAAFPSGNYTINVTGATDGARAVTVDLSGDNYPSTPRLANWTDAQVVDPTQAFPLTWDPMIGGTTDDIIMIEVRQETQQGDNTVFETPPPTAPGQLNGTNTTVSIPANTLSAGHRYQLVIRFIKAVDLDDTTYVSTLAGYMKETHVDLHTTGADSVAPEIESIRPPYGTTNVKDISSVVFRFNEAMDTGVSGAQSITWTGVPNAANFSYSWSSDGRELFCRYSPSLPLNATIGWTLNPTGSAAKLQDTAGNDLSDNLSGQFSTATGSDVGQPDLSRLFVLKSQGFLQTNTTPTALELYAFELKTDLNGFGTLSSATMSAAFGGPLPYPTDHHSGDSMGAEANYASQADLDAFFPSISSYTNDFVGFQDGAQRIILDFPADNYPNTPTVLNFSTLAAVDPDQPLTISWSPMTIPAADDYIVLLVENDYGTTLYESPLPGEPNALTGSATSVTIAAGTLPPGRSFEAELIFLKAADVDETSYTHASATVRAMAFFAKLTEFELTTTGTPIVPSIEALSTVSSGGPTPMFQFRVRGEYGMPYTLESSSDLPGFSHVFNSYANTVSTNGTGTFEFSDPNSSGQPHQFYRAYEGFSNQQPGQP